MPDYDTALVDLDDLWCEEQITQHLLPLKEAVPHLSLTLYGIPALLGPVHDLSARYPWITFAIHGFFHTFAECGAWLQEDCERLVKLALDMGYAPLFKPPNWIMDNETEHGLVTLDVALHCHPDYWPQTVGVRWYSRPLPIATYQHCNIHTHLANSPRGAVAAGRSSTSAPSSMRSPSTSSRTTASGSCVSTAPLPRFYASTALLFARAGAPWRRGLALLADCSLLLMATTAFLNTVVSPDNALLHPSLVFTLPWLRGFYR